MKLTDQEIHNLLEDLDFYNFAFDSLRDAADLATEKAVEFCKEREEKLIQAGYHAWVHLTKPDNYAQATNVIYKIAGIEELK